MVWWCEANLEDMLAHSRELKAEARNLRMKLQYLSRSYPMRGGFGPTPAPSRHAVRPADKPAQPDGRRR